MTARTTPSYNARYTFSAKEKDAETGYSYFGARYYNSALSIWLSVDPMAGKYPSMSPYVYCAGNPVRCVDPNGMEIINEYKECYLRAKSNLESAQAKLNSFGGSKKADGYKDAKKQLRDAKNEYNSANYAYNQVQGALNDVKKYNPELFSQLDNLQDDNGNIVDVYVGINSDMNLRGRYHDTFDEKSQQFISPHGLSTVQIDLNPGSFDFPNDLGEILSHEGGHALYSISNNKAYSKWLQNNIPFINTHNGHDYGDPSGKEAHKQQNIYCKNKGIPIHNMNYFKNEY